MGVVRVAVGVVGVFLVELISIGQKDANINFKFQQFLNVTVNPNQVSVSIYSVFSKIYTVGGSH